MCMHKAQNVIMYYAPYLLNAYIYILGSASLRAIDPCSQTARGARHVDRYILYIHTQVTILIICYRRRGAQKDAPVVLSKRDTKYVQYVNTELLSLYNINIVTCSVTMRGVLDLTAGFNRRQKYYKQNNTINMDTVSNRPSVSNLLSRFYSYPSLSVFSTSLCREQRLQLGQCHVVCGVVCVDTAR